MTLPGFEWMEFWAVDHSVYGRMFYRQFSHAWWFVESSHERDVDVTPENVSLIAFQAGVPGEPV